jgi:hypothetical protein
MSSRNKIACLDTLLNSILHAFTKSWDIALRMDLDIMPTSFRPYGWPAYLCLHEVPQLRHLDLYTSRFPLQLPPSLLGLEKSWCRSFCPKALQSSSPCEARDEVSTLLSRRATASNYTRALYSDS